MWERTPYEHLSTSKRGLLEEFRTNLPEAESPGSPPKKSARLMTSNAGVANTLPTSKLLALSVGQVESGRRTESPAKGDKQARLSFTNSTSDTFVNLEVDAGDGFHIAFPGHQC